MDVGGVVSEEQQLGQVVQAARKGAGLTQQALCQRSGLSYSTLAKIERGAIKSPSVFTIQHIASTLGISLDQLMESVPNTAGHGPQPAVPKKVSRNGVRFIYFDMNGCLVRAGVSKAATKLATDSGVTPDVIESIFWQYDGQICRGDMGVEVLNTALSQRLGIPVDWNNYYLASVEPTPQIAELVAWAAENYRIGILTDTLPGLVQPMLQNGTLPSVQYDAVVESSSVHALKPEPKIFEIAAGKAGVQPTEILLVDDDKQNLSAAAQLGWHTMSFDAFQPEQSIIAVANALQPAEELTAPETAPAQPVAAPAQPEPQPTGL